MAAVSAGRFIIRPAVAGDMEAVRAVVTRAGLSSGQPAALEYCRTGPGGRLVVACRHDGVCYGIWTRGQQSLPVADGEAGAGPGRIADALRHDAEATGEDRGSFLRTFAARVRTPAGQAGAGYRIALPWGRGPVVASGPDAARALVTDMLRAGSDQSLTFPESNTGATELATALGFRLTRRCTRMRLGPPVRGFAPERVFNVFSLAVG